MLSCISSDLAAALQSPIDFETGKAGHRSWKVPASMSDKTRNEAAAAYANAKRLLWLASQNQISDWLMQLGVLVAGSMSAQDAGLKISAYASLLDDLPVGVLTKQSLKSAGASFKFFPTFSEVNEFLEIETANLKRYVQRLEVLASHRPAIAKSATVGEAQISEADKQKVADIVASIAKKLSSTDKQPASEV